MCYKIYKQKRTTVNKINEMKRFKNETNEIIY
ncbi:hypothetical protein S122051_2088 [Staphylococcus aureus subsp. aureus 122051]|nr:hypothetical protein S122051_2088 [Staphylococcus aureus subsp. aureus 122051]